MECRPPKAGSREVRPREVHESKGGTVKWKWSTVGVTRWGECGGVMEIGRRVSQCAHAGSSSSRVITQVSSSAGSS
eukprot:scaffold35308_cov32-Tisochrysis_lutea.AAC.1